MTRTPAIVSNMDGVPLSRVIEGKQDRTDVVTSVVDGVSYLQELHPSNTRFTLQNGIEGAK
jgi:hypothetical protein